MSNPAGSKDLHGNAPDNAPVVLLIIDAINDLAFEEGREVLGKAIRMAHKIRLLKARARRVGIPAIYVNDNFGRWRSDFRNGGRSLWTFDVARARSHSTTPPGFARLLRAQA